MLLSPTEQPIQASNAVRSMLLVVVRQLVKYSANGMKLLKKFIFECCLLLATIMHYKKTNDPAETAVA